MLGKLVKNELKSYRFSMGIVFLAGFIFTIFMKIICMLPYQYEIREVIQVLGFYGYDYAGGCGSPGIGCYTVL
mgnify:CR=1 FL=1